MDEKEHQNLELEDILKEFGDNPQTEETPEEESEYLREDLPWKMPVREETEVADDTVTVDLAAIQKAAQETKTDEKTVIIDLNEIHNAMTQEENLADTRRMDPIPEAKPQEKQIK